MICVFGAGMVTGNVVGPRFADRALLPTIGWALVWNVAVLALFSVAVHNAWTAVPAIFLVGTMFAAGPALQTQLMDVGKEAQVLAAALNHSAFNIANALGAWLGGVAVSAGYGWASTGWLGAAFASAGSGSSPCRWRWSGRSAPAFGRVRCPGGAVACRPIGLRRGPVQSCRARSNPHE